jgi:hypothetical protein
VKSEIPAVSLHYKPVGGRRATVGRGGGGGGGLVGWLVLGGGEGRKPGVWELTVTVRRG